MATDSSYRTILRATTIVGGSSVSNILIGLIRIKALALILGPAGVGLVGLLDGIVRSASTLTGIGLSTSGVRQLAISAGDPVALALVRRALFIANLLLGIAGGVLLCVFRTPIALFVFGDSGQTANVGWLGLGVLLTLIAASQTALLQGLRHIGDMAKVSVFGALAGSMGGVLAIWQWGQAGIVTFILLPPASTVIAGLYYVSQLPRTAEIQTPIAKLAPQWREMATLGFAFMLMALLTECTQLFVRSLIGRTLSLEATGHFQAAWTISMQYIGFVLTAMAADYYPRLAGSIKDKQKSNRMVNEQIKASLLLGGPIMLGMLALAPWVIELLYSKDFSESIGILRWQVLGDVMKVAGWPMGFILIARAERGWFLFTQSFWNGSYALLVWLGLPILGLSVTGIAFFACYFLGFLVNSLIVHQVAGFSYTSGNMRLLASLLLGSATIVALSYSERTYSLIVGLILATLFGAYAAMRLLQLSYGRAAISQAVARAISMLKRWR